MRAQLSMLGLLLFVALASGCDNPHSSKPVNAPVANVGGQEIVIEGVRFHPNDGSGGGAGGTVTITGVNEGIGGRAVRVIVTNDPNGNRIYDPSDPTWIYESTPPPTPNPPHHDDPAAPVPRPITEPIPLGPGEFTIVVVVEVLDTNGIVITIPTIVEVKKSRRRGG